MCSNYIAVTRTDRLLTFFGVARDPSEPPPEFSAEIWPQRLAPFIRRAEDGSGNRQIEAGQFGLLPFFAKELAYGRRTYNARSETVATLPSFRDAWKRGQRCIVPAEAIFEPCWETGTAVRWRIQQAGEVPMGIAGVWARHPKLTTKDGKPMLSFAMLTVNADGHPVFKRMHRPEDEKRMVVILDPAEYDRWLQCTVAEAASFFRQWTGALDAFPAPLPPRRRQGADEAAEPPDDA
ncbi:MAG: SOS response-associated peptidase [Proteobacteria bacterium]|nr:SOS response-associated peptidase [Pseudomonadota bacterium]